MVYCASQAKLRFYVAVAFLCLLAGCTSLIGPYSPTAYQNATSLKATTLTLMDKATEPYSVHQKDIESLSLEIDKAYEFVNGVPSNSISATQWLLLKKPDGDLLGKFFLRWKEADSEKNGLSPTFVVEFKGQVSDAYDEIICLEANKKQATQCSKKGGK
jgi:hypothetical protein